jgi:hypothetical protein
MATPTPWIRLEARVVDFNGGTIVLNIRTNTIGVEDQHLTLNMPLIRNLATAAGGQILNASTLHALPDSAKQTDTTMTETEMDDMWNTGSILTALFCIFCIELFVRRWLKLL